MRILIAFFTLLFISSYIAAEEVNYVTDSFSITMRTGKGTDHKIIKSLKTGTKVNVIAVDDEGYSNIRLDDGTEGWVLTRYLINQPVARTQLEQNEQLVKKLKEEVANLNEQIKKTSSNNSSLEQDTSRLSKANQKLTKELDHIKTIASNQLALNEENKSLKEKVLTLKREMQTIQEENLTLRDNSGRDWFLIGAGVCILGIVLGLVLPNLRLRRRQSWNSL